MTVTVKILSRINNKVEAEVSVNVSGSNDNREEIIIGNIGIYIKSVAFDEDYFFVYLMLDNLSKKDTGDIYSCTISSNKLEMVNQRFICDDSQWRNIFYNCNNFEPNFKFDLTVEVNIVEMKNPLAVLHDDTEMLDFELCGTDGSVKFHSTVLACASPVLKQMLTGQWSETKNRSVQLQDTTKQTLQHFKDYIYLNVLPNDGLEHLLLLASYYLVTELERKCIDKLLMNVNAESSSELVKFALTHKLMSLYYGFLKLVQRGVIPIEEKME